jgi:dienelactone hydrolase
MRFYGKLMHDWEWRLNRRDNNRVVRPLDWGIEWTRRWPGVNGSVPGPEQAESYIRDLNRRLLAESAKFFSYETPTDFRLQDRHLRFTSAVETPYPDNNQVVARWFPARGNRAVVVLPQWNCDVASHTALCRIFNLLGIAALRMSLPYHDLRKPAEIERADYAVSANIGRTLDAGRQAVVDARSCLDWLEQQGYSRLGIVGSSLGSCYAFIASAHDDRLKVNIFNHASTRFADVVWAGQTTRHIRQAIDGKVDLESLRESWALIAPISYFDRFASMQKKSLVVYASYDLTFPPELSLQIIRELRGRGAELDVKVLPCGHYSSGETPFKYLDAWYMARFLEHAF